jgi:hypothetical protein
LDKEDNLIVPESWLQETKIATNLAVIDGTQKRSMAEFLKRATDLNKWNATRATKEKAKPVYTVKEGARLPNQTLCISARRSKHVARTGT